MAVMQLGSLERSTAGATGFVAVYTCPANRRTIVKELIASWATADPATILIFIGADGINIPHLWATQSGFGVIERLERWTVMHPGDVLYVALSVTTTGDNVAVVASGAELVV